MSVSNNKVKKQLFECSICLGKGLQGGLDCQECGGVGHWGTKGGLVIYTSLPKIAVVNKISGLLSKISRLVLIGLWVLGTVGIIIFIRNIFYNLDIAHDRWFDFSHLGFDGIIAYLGIMSWLFLFYWYLDGRRPAKRLPVNSISAVEGRASVSWKELVKMTSARQLLQVQDYLEHDALFILNRASQFAVSEGHKFFTIPHVMKAMLNYSSFHSMLIRLGLDKRNLEQYVDRRLEKMEKRLDDHVVLDTDIRKLLTVSALIAFDFRHKTIRNRDIFLAILDLDEDLQHYLQDFNVHLKEAEHVAHWLDSLDASRQWWRQFSIGNFSRMGKMDKGWLGGWTLTLDRHSTDLTKAARKGYLRQVVGRTQEIEEMVRILSRSSKRNVILIGDAGVGKSTIIEGLAHHIISGEADDVLRDKRLIQLNIASVLGGSKDSNQFGDQMVSILREVTKAKNVILCIDGIHNLQGTGAAEGSGLDAFSILVPALERNEFQCIGTTSFREYHRFIESDDTIARCFEKVEVREPDMDDAISILQEVVLKFERKHRVVVSHQAIKAAIELSNKYIRDKVLPDKAVDLLDEACVEKGRQKREKIVTRQDVAHIIASKTNIPVKDVTAEESAKLLNLEQVLHERLVNQKTAVKAVCNAVRRARVGLRDSNRPIATFLFIGPTGVGKTELAKTLAEAYFGHENTMIRLDMSEYQKIDSISRLVGPPPGEPGSESGGQLTQAVRKRPFSLLLLDEFEKACSDIHHIFLQVFDDGRLTDSSGRVVDFTNVVIIATSNAGAKMIQDGIIQGRELAVIEEDIKRNVLPTLFKPELINRFDDIILFKPLNLEQVNEIAERMLNKIRIQLQQQDIDFKITSEAIAKLANLGFDPVYGARPLRRVIQEKIEDPVAGKILRSEIAKGDTIIVREQDI